MKLLPLLKASLLALVLVACNEGANNELTGGRRPQGAQGAADEDDEAADKKDDVTSSTPNKSVVASTPTPGNNNNNNNDDDDTKVDDGLDEFAKKTLARAKEWVDVKMPYCGGVNNGTDYLCGGKCVRTGIHASPAWDPYRTDCSGFVSWSWSLPAPGRITTGFAPYNLDVTTAIPVDDLLPGDALNNENHIILFGGWANPERTKARLLEEYDCGQVAVDRIRDVSKVSEKQLSTPSGNFTAIRLDSRPGFTPPP